MRLTDFRPSMTIEFEPECVYAHPKLEYKLRRFLKRG